MRMNMAKRAESIENARISIEKEKEMIKSDIKKSREVKQDQY